MSADLQQQIDAVAAALGGPRFMDFPDGGSPTIAEQVGRLRQELEAAEAEADDLRAELVSVLEGIHERADETDYALVKRIAELRGRA